MGRQEETFGPHAPDKNVPFPASANITAVELLTFFPNCLKSADVVYRFISNGATREVLWAIVNTARDLEKEWNANCTGRCMYDAMRRAGFEKWTVKIHDRWHAGRSAVWDKWNIDVSGFRTPCEITENGKCAADVAFADLVADVRYLPGGDDALDLTRMVQYCVEHPEEGWIYPKDYELLLGLLGGPRKVQVEHVDGAAFARWRDLVPPPPYPRSPKSLTPPESRKSGASRRSSRNQEGRSQDKPKRGRPRKSVQVDKSTKGPVDEQTRQATEDDVRASFYVRGPAKWVAPTSSIEEFPDELVYRAFLAERSAGEMDAFSPDAFDGPRVLPPYRSLHRIGNPHPDDVSGWAENLRWAQEQAAMFGTGGWNESPEHMESIVEARMKQQWVSDEWLEVYRLTAVTANAEEGGFVSGDRADVD